MNEAEDSKDYGTEERATADWHLSDNSTTIATIEKYIHVFMIPSAMVTILGTISNATSLSYFLTQIKLNNRRTSTEALNRRLFILLNILDILVCISLTALLIAVISSENMLIGICVYSFFMFAIMSTSFITCLLTVIRAISITWPHYGLNTKAVFVSVVLYSLMILTLENILRKPCLVMELIVLISLFLVVVLSNTLCIVKLMRSKIASWKREATITVGILSILYCTLNIGFLVDFGTSIFKCNVYEYCPKEREPYVEMINMFVLLPLNSACNPIVYFARNAEMRKFLMKAFVKIRTPCTSTVLVDRDNQTQSQKVLDTRLSLGSSKD
jgi:hypothetical protein